MLPLKSFTLEKLENMQKEAAEKAKEQLKQETIKEEEDLMKSQNPTHAPETMSFE